MNQAQPPRLDQQQSTHSLHEVGTFPWRLIAVLSLVGCIAAEVLQNIAPIDHNTLLLFWFFPASLLLFSQLYIGSLFTRYFEIKLLLVFFGWACTTVALNHASAQMVDSYQWFAGTCAAIFLCFSLPYAYEQASAKRVLTWLAVATLIAVMLLSVVCLIAVFAKDVAAKAPSIFDGIEIAGGRLRINNHPNRSAPLPAIGVILAGYLLAASKKGWQRVLTVLCGAVCFIPLALTASRTAIISTGIAVGFEVFIALGDALKNRMRVPLRWFLCVVAACFVIFAVYKGSEFVAQASNIAVASQSGANEEEIAARDLSDADNFNGRTDIWLGVWNGLLENPKILAFGTGPTLASGVMTPYFPADSPIGIFHNSLLGTLVAFGVPGLILAVAFIALVARAAIRLSFGRKQMQSLAVRMLPAVVLFAVSEGMMEDFLFSVCALNIVWVWFMIAAGFILRLGKEEPAGQVQEQL